jgi:hypothetical protein
VAAELSGLILLAAAPARRGDRRRRRHEPMRGQQGEWAAEYGDVGGNGTGERGGDLLDICGASPKRGHADAAAASACSGCKRGGSRLTATQQRGTLSGLRLIVAFRHASLNQRGTVRQPAASRNSPHAHFHLAKLAD